MKQLILLCSLFFLNEACVKRSHCCALPPLEMVRTQTQCADTWGYGNSSVETIDKLKRYLTEKNISFYAIELQVTGESSTCAACTCSKGYAFHVWVEQRYLDSLAKEGFVLK